LTSIWCPKTKSPGCEYAHPGQVSAGFWFASHPGAWLCATSAVWISPKRLRFGSGYPHHGDEIWWGMSLFEPDTPISHPEIHPQKIA